MNYGVIYLFIYLYGTLLSRNQVLDKFCFSFFIYFVNFILLSGLQIFQIVISI